MQFFLDFIKENQRLNSLLNAISEYKGHQGTTIRFSDSFLNIYSLTKKLEKDEIPSIFYSYERLFRYGYNFEYMFDISIFGSTELIDASKISFREIRYFKSLIPENVDNKYFCPIEVIISLFNDADNEIFESLINENKNNGDFRIVMERRSRNTFLNSQSKHNPLIGGISISGHSERGYGTLGGLLKDNQGKIFGMTCSHVVSAANESVFQPANYDSKNDKRVIGKVSFLSDLHFCDSQSHCSPETGSDNMDVALINIDESEKCEFGVHKLGNISRLKEFKDLYQGMKVEFNGRSTNERKQLIVGGLTVSYKIAYEQDSIPKYACFTNLIELRSVPIKVLGTNNYLQEMPAKAGDSGAWICSNDSEGYSWAAMLISGDADRGYCLSSEHILKWLENAGYSLQL